MQKNLNRFERIIRLLLAAFSLFAAAALFVHPLARTAALLFGVYSVWEAFTGRCPLHARLGVRSPSDQMVPGSLYLLGLLGIQVVMSYEWMTAGYGKIAGGKFASSLGTTLANFASKNPYPWYKSFLENVAMKHAGFLGLAVEWSQVIIGVVLFAAAATIAWSGEKRERLAMAASTCALAAGMLMNANFYLASGWTGAGGKTANIVMFWTQALLAYSWMTTLLAVKWYRSPKAA